MTSRGDGSGGAGTPDANVADAQANGILWVNAAGNEAQTPLERHVRQSGAFITIGADNFPLKLGGGDIGNTFSLQAERGLCLPEVG